MRRLRAGPSIALAVLACAVAVDAGRATPPLPWRPSAPEAFRAPLPANETSERERLAKLGQDFRIERTDHWSLAVHVEARTASYRGKILEDLHGAFTRYFTDLGLDLEPPAQAHALVFTPDRERFAALTGADDRARAIQGVYDPDRRIAFFFDSLGRPDVRAEREAVGELEGDLRAIRRRVAREDSAARVTLAFRRAPRRTFDRDEALEILDDAIRDLERRDRDLVYDLGEDGIGIMNHEAAHQLCWEMGLFATESNPPRWLSEGIATLFEPTRHGFLLETSKPHWGRWANLDTRRRAGRPLALRELLASDARLLASDAADRREAYDDAWALVHFLVTTRPEAFAEYLRGVRTPGASATPEKRIALFERTFGERIADLEERLRRFVARLDEGDSGGVDAFRDRSDESP